MEENWFGRLFKTRLDFILRHWFSNLSWHHNHLAGLWESGRHGPHLAFRSSRVELENFPLVHSQLLELLLVWGPHWELLSWHGGNCWRNLRWISKITFMVQYKSCSVFQDGGLGKGGKRRKEGSLQLVNTCWCQALSCTQFHFIVWLWCVSLNIFIWRVVEIAQVL